MQEPKLSTLFPGYASVSLALALLAANGTVSALWKLVLIGVILVLQVDFFQKIRAAERCVEETKSSSESQ